jgi:hypothetical protein
MKTTEHLLTCLIEECAEVQKHATKALRFGLEDRDPTIPNSQTESELIEYELDDLRAVVEMLTAAGVIHGWPSWRRVDAKKEKIREFMEYAQQTGALEKA